MRKALVYILVMSTILMSGAAFYSIDEENSRIFWGFYFCLIVFCSFIFRERNRRIEASQILSPFLLVVLLAISYFLNIGNWSAEGERGIATFAVKILAVFAMMRFLNAEDYRVAFVHCTSCIAIVSLVFFTIGRLNQNLALQMITGRTGVLGYNCFYMWGWDGGISPRNAGPFWEPGAFQGILIISLILALKNPELFKNIRALVSILLVTLITTQSSTGYILTLLVLIKFNSDITGIYQSRALRAASAKAVSIPIMISVIVLGVLLVPNIYDKVFSSNVSATIRSGDFSGGLLMLGGSRLFGIGYGSPLMDIRQASNVSMANSVGLFSMITIYGILFSAIYISLLVKGSISVLNPSSVSDCVVVAIIMIVLQCTEVVFYMPVYLAFLFKPGSEHPVLINNSKTSKNAKMHSIEVSPLIS